MEEGGRSYGQKKEKEGREDGRGTCNDLSIKVIGIAQKGTDTRFGPRHAMIHQFVTLKLCSSFLLRSNFHMCV